ncbi:MAG TPA: hypothetical protein VD993_20820 [Chitinophagaceae bacterium]|nr:hypothetical protein [Chitinophagaceae bacterium]
MKLNISNMTDRQLLEQVFATQVILTRQLYRMKDFLVKKYNADFVDEEEERDEVFEKLQSDIRRLLKTESSSLSGGNSSGGLE